MASFGRKAQFSFPLGGDIPEPNENVFGRISRSPTGIRFANLPLAKRGTVGITQSVMPSYSSPVTTAQTMTPSDHDILSGVIRKRGRKTNHTLPSGIRG